MKSHEFLPKSTTDTTAWKKKKKNGALPIREGKVTEGDFANLLGAGALTFGAMTGGIGAVHHAWNSLTDPDYEFGKPAKTAKSTQQQPKIVVPAAKQGWKHHADKNDFDGTTFKWQSLTSTDRICELQVSNDGYVSIKCLDKIDSKFHYGTYATPGRIKIDGIIYKTDSFNLNHNTLSIGPEVGIKLMKTKQPIQVELYLRDEGRKVFTFNP